MSTKPYRTALLVATVSLIFTKFPIPVAWGQDMSNEEFILDLNPTRVKPSQSPIPKPTDSPREDGSFLRTGSPLFFTLNEQELNYGKIKAGEPIVRDTKVEVKSPAGFTVVAFEEDTLKSEDNQAIPDVTCDQGTCSHLLAAKWSSPLTYGFGYSCNDKKASICLNTFVDQTTYKQFSNISNSEKPEIVLNSSLNESGTAKLSFKVNIPAHLNNLSFSNTVHLIALPKLEGDR